MSRIFISYKRVDRDKVFKIKDQIECCVNEKCWIDIDGIESDAQFKNVIIKALNECEIVLFMYSKAHAEIIDFEKDWTVRELNFAASKNKRIVFVNIDGSPLTDEFSFDYGTKQQVDGRSQEKIGRLIRDLNKWLSRENISTRLQSSHDPKDTTTEDKTKPPRRVDSKNSYYSFFRKSKKIILTFVLIFIAGFFLLTLIYSSRIITVESRVEDIEKEVVFEGVDLGLPSGTLWANMNVGSLSPSDYGEFYSWGEIKTKNNYQQLGYNIIQQVDISGTSYDVANIKYGTEWQIPTAVDFDELIQNCSWTWITINGHEGYNVTGKNGQSIFLPAAGWMCSDIPEYQGQYGYYWTSIKVNDTFAKVLLFGKSEKKIGNGYLYYGRCIRPIRRDIVVE